MSDINSAFTVDVGLSLEDVVGVFYGVSDPSSGGGNVAPKGSIYLQVPASGEAQLWKKYAAADTAWKPLQTKTYSTSSSPGVTNDDADTAALGRTFDIGDAWVNTATDTVYVCVDNATGAAIWQNQIPPVVESIVLACSDETTDLVAGTAKITFRMPYAFTVTGVRASLTVAATGATLLQVDINESGSSILSTEITVDAGEVTSTTAATPAVISDGSLADDAEITVDLVAVGNTTPGKGLKVYLIGTQT